jgi:hypothetical protein
MLVGMIVFESLRCKCTILLCSPLPNLRLLHLQYFILINLLLMPQQLHLHLGRQILNIRAQLESFNIRDIIDRQSISLEDESFILYIVPCFANLPYGVRLCLSISRIFFQSPPFLDWVMVLVLLVTIAFA